MMTVIVVMMVMVTVIVVMMVMMEMDDGGEVVMVDVFAGVLEAVELIGESTTTPPRLG